MAGNSSTFIELTVSIVSAYVSNNPVPAAELSALIGQVHTALTRVSSGHGESPGDGHKPAIPVRKSVTSDYIICLEDGKKFKSLKRHLRTRYKLTPEQYRENGVSAAIIPWSPPTMQPRARALPSRWASASSDRAANNPAANLPRRRRYAFSHGASLRRLPARHAHRSGCAPPWIEIHWIAAA